VILHVLTLMTVHVLTYTDVHVTVLHVTSHVLNNVRNKPALKTSKEFTNLREISFCNTWKELLFSSIKAL
jgi:hypothetical protein